MHANGAGRPMLHSPPVRFFTIPGHNLCNYVIFCIPLCRNLWSLTPGERQKCVFGRAKESRCNAMRGVGAEPRIEKMDYSIVAGMQQNHSECDLKRPNLGGISISHSVFYARAPPASRMTNSARCPPLNLTGSAVRCAQAPCARTRLPSISPRIGFLV